MQTALLLAGGRASRYGQTKAAVIWQGRSLAARAAGVLAQVAPRVILVGPPGPRPEWAPADCEWLADPYPHGGPLVGLVEGLKVAGQGGVEVREAVQVEKARKVWEGVKVRQTVGGDWVAVAPCDVPLVTAGTYRRLHARALEEDRTAVAVCQGEVQPLVGVYARQAALTAAQEVLARGVRSMKGLLEVLDHALVELPEVGCNLNTPADLHRLEAEQELAEGWATGPQ